MQAWSCLSCRTAFVSLKPKASSLLPAACSCACAVVHTPISDRQQLRLSKKQTGGHAHTPAMPKYLSPAGLVGFTAALSAWYTDGSTPPLNRPVAQAAKYHVQACDLRCPARQWPAVPDRRGPGGPDHAHRQSRGESAGHPGCPALMYVFSTASQLRWPSCMSFQ